MAPDSLPCIELEVPRKLLPLLEPKRYKAAHGGRGGAKSHFFAEQLILRCFERITRAVCIREVQLAIKESVKQLLTDKIDKLGLGWRGATEKDDGQEFVVTDSEIRGRNGSLIIFKGMQSFNAANIKSLEGMDICWIEEAQTISAFSWRLLRPTIRKETTREDGTIESSEIWCSWNPRHDTDAVDEFFRGPFPPDPSECTIVEVNWQDNPWFPSVLRKEMERDRKADADMAVHVWDGGYEIVSEGAYYARALATADKRGRVGSFPYKAGQLVQTSWDLGLRDHTCIWFWVEDMEYVTVVDYYEIAGEGFDHIVATCMPELFILPALNADYLHWTKDKALVDFKRPIPFRYKMHWLPHDVAVREQANAGRARYETLRELGLTAIVKGSATNPEDRINAVRTVLPRVRFNNSPRVMRGIKRLRQYKRKFNEGTGEYEGPLHDDASHAADAFGEYAINCPFFEAPVIKQTAIKTNPHGYEIASNGSVIAGQSVDRIIAAKARLAAKRR
jgi:phage terminase large subunit